MTGKTYLEFSRAGWSSNWPLWSRGVWHKWRNSRCHRRGYWRNRKSPTFPCPAPRPSVAPAPPSTSSAQGRTPRWTASATRQRLCRVFPWGIGTPAPSGPSRWWPSDVRPWRTPLPSGCFWPTRIQRGPCPFWTRNSPLSRGICSRPLRRANTL